MNCWHPGRKQPPYQRPGFESAQHDGRFRLEFKGLRRLLEPAQWACIDARPRIVARDTAQLEARRNLVDLEHARLRQCMLAPSALPASLGAYTWW